MTIREKSLPEFYKKYLLEQRSIRVNEYGTPVGFPDEMYLLKDFPADEINFEIEDTGRISNEPFKVNILYKVSFYDDMTKIAKKVKE